MDQEMLLTVVWDSSPFLGEVHVQLGQNGSSEKCTYWSESMNMLIGMAPKMCHHTVTGTGGGRPD